MFEALAKLAEKTQSRTKFGQQGQQGQHEPKKPQKPKANDNLFPIAQGFENGQQGQQESSRWATEKTAGNKDFSGRVALVAHVAQDKEQDRNETGWHARDWRAFFDERAGIAEYDGELSRAEAEREAFKHTVAEYLARNPPEPSSPEACVHCDLLIEEVGRDGIPVLAGEAGHVWLHHDCHRPWRSKRSHHASQALTRMGVGS